MHHEGSLTSIKVSYDCKGYGSPVFITFITYIARFSPFLNLKDIRVSLALIIRSYAPTKSLSSCLFLKGSPLNFYTVGYFVSKGQTLDPIHPYPF